MCGFRRESDVSREEEIAKIKQYLELNKMHQVASHRFTMIGTSVEFQWPALFKQRRDDGLCFPPAYAFLYVSTASASSPSISTPICNTNNLTDPSSLLLVLQVTDLLSAIPPSLLRLLERLLPEFLD